jgi:hypothetical protein
MRGHKFRSESAEPWATSEMQQIATKGALYRALTEGRARPPRQLDRDCRATFASSASAQCDDSGTEADRNQHRNQKPSGGCRAACMQISHSFPNLPSDSHNMF